MAEKNKALKQRKKREQEKIEEGKLWDKFDTLDTECKAIRNIKKQKKNVKGNIKIDC